MANEAEVDLLINAAGALPELERDLNRIITTAQNNADDVDVNAVLQTQGAVTRITSQLNTLVRRAEAGADDVDVTAVLNQLQSLNSVRRTLDDVVTQVQSGAPDIDVTAVLARANSLRNIRRDLTRMTNDLSRTTNPVLIRADVDDDARGTVRRLGSALSSFGRTAATVVGRVARLVAVITALSAAGAVAIPVVAGIVAAVQSILPAATVAVSGMLALGLAAGTVKLAMVGVGDAIELAFDRDAKPEDLEASLKRLAPNAREFVKELQSMRSGLGRLQREVQNRFFDGFADTLERVSDAVLPDLRRGLNATADSFNRAGREAGATAAELGDRGILGQAIDSATRSLQAMERVPAQIVASLGLLAAAGGPMLERFAERVAGVFDRMTEGLATAFETGELERDVEGAVDVIQQLGRIAGNVFGGLGNIFGGVTEEAGSLFFILEGLTAAFERLTASAEFQTILRELVDTAGVLVDNILPLLQEAFIQLAPVIEELGPPVRDFINQVGPELIPLLRELGPVLLDLAVIFREQLPFAIEVVKAAIQVLGVVLKGMHFILETLIIPVVTKVSEVMNSTYVKAIAAMSRETASRIANVLQRFESFRQGVTTAIRAGMQRLSDFVVRLVGFANGVRNLVNDVVRFFSTLPSRIREALGNLTSLLYRTGRDIISGLINGITSRLGSLLSTVSNMAASIRDTAAGVLDIFSPSRVMAEIGRDTVDGVIVGIKNTVPALLDTVADMARSIPRAATAQDASRAGTQPFALGLTPELAPAVNVFIGSERLDSRIDYRVQSQDRTRQRDRAQGWRY